MCSVGRYGGFARRQYRKRFIAAEWLSRNVSQLVFKASRAFIKSCDICMCSFIHIMVISRIWEPRVRFNIKTVFPGIGNPSLKIWRSWDRLIFTIGFLISVERHLCTETAPRSVAKSSWFTEVERSSVWLHYCHYRCRRLPPWRRHFRVTGPLWGESTHHRWIPLTKASDAELWCFLWSAPEQTVEQIIETPVIWDAITLIMTSL